MRRRAREVRGILFARALRNPLARSAMMASRTPVYSIIINSSAVVNIVL